ncbi:hypothetical protein PCC8801_0368 [Rippkaea orientalis PCC 8801]|uniref:SnoaL-like domain-containing protein n=1 Tax=Rippkaea orientalis (strain PCC 8801 / RF-1) TaxID=41431 RepID=B7JU86_RIPO1|nr:nuclear transport factor 2 family protein [Rippkaea orientalis]ACK64466.1 hypothetical protein PCC8801_0368 [Rippkaea orientalis PCC 8801]
MEGVPSTLLGKMYQEHIQYLLDKDIEGILNNQYTEDALLISSFTKEPQYFKGREQLKEHFQGILAIENLQTEVTFWAETDDPQTLMIVEAITMKTPEGEAKMRFADSWVLRDGKIAIHFAGMTQYPDGSVA